MERSQDVAGWVGTTSARMGTDKPLACFFCDAVLDKWPHYAKCATFWNLFLRHLLLSREFVTSMLLPSYSPAIVPELVHTSSGMVVLSIAFQTYNKIKHSQGLSFSHACDAVIRPHRLFFHARLWQSIVSESGNKSVPDSKK